MTSWAASSGDPFDAIRRFLVDMQDWWGQPRGPHGQDPRGQGAHGRGPHGQPDEDRARGDQWSQTREEPRPGAGYRGEPGPGGERQPGPHPEHGPDPHAGSGPRPSGPFGAGFGGWGGPGNRFGGPFPFPFGWPGGAGRGSWPGGPGRGWHGGPRGPRAGRGDVRLAILALLAEQPMHGYQLIQEIARRSAGVWKPSPGSVYPTLQQLEDEGLVHADEREGKRVYALTDEGRAFADERAAEFASMWDGYQPNDDDAALGDLVFGVASAFVHVMRTGSDRQIAAARGVLARTRADLYRILGEDAHPGEPGDRAGDAAEAPRNQGDNEDTERSGAGSTEPETGEDEWGSERS